MVSLLDVIAPCLLTDRILARWQPSSTLPGAVSLCSMPRAREL